MPSNILTQKFYEVQKHLTVSYHGQIAYALITNKTFWNSLPADVRAQLDRAVTESTEFFNATAAKDNADALDKIKASGRPDLRFDRSGKNGLDRQADAGAYRDAGPASARTSSNGSTRPRASRRRSPKADQSGRVGVSACGDSCCSTASSIASKSGSSFR